MVYPDGTPAADVWVEMGIYVTSQGNTGGLFGQTGNADASGVFDFSFGYDLGSATSYSIYWDIYDSQGGNLLAQGQAATTGAVLTAGTFAEKITLPPKGEGINYGKALFKCLQNATYVYNCYDNGGTVVAHSTGAISASSTVDLPVPTQFAPTDELTFTVVGTNSEKGIGKKGPIIASAKIKGSAFISSGVLLTIDFGGGGGGHGGGGKT